MKCRMDASATCMMYLAHTSSDALILAFHAGLLFLSFVFLLVVIFACGDTAYSIRGYQ